MPILRGTNSALLPCGCLIGLYETYRGSTVAIVDLKGPACTDRPHRVDARVSWPVQTDATTGRVLSPSLPQEDSPRGAQR